jgi:hypothetical protein
MRVPCSSDANREVIRAAAHPASIRTTCLIGRSATITLARLANRPRRDVYVDGPAGITGEVGLPEIHRVRSTDEPGAGRSLMTHVRQETGGTYPADAASGPLLSLYFGFQRGKLLSLVLEW